MDLKLYVSVYHDLLDLVRASALGSHCTALLPGIEPRSPALQVDCLLPKPPGKTQEGLDVLGLVREEGELQDLARVFQKKLKWD